MKDREEKLREYLAKLNSKEMTQKRQQKFKKNFKRKVETIEKHSGE